MQNDFITLNRLKEELKKFLLNGYIDNVIMPANDLIILSINNDYKHYNLLISCSSNYPRIHLTNKKYETPKNAYPFCMQLRKLLKSSKIVEISLLENDRIFKITFITKSELKEEKKYSLIFENMGRFSNIFLLNEENKILNVSKPLFFDENAKRQLFVGCIYKPFRNSKKPINLVKEEDILNINKETFFEYILNNFSGVSKKTLNEILIRSVENLHKLFVKNLNDFLNSKEIYLQIDKNSNPEDILVSKYVSIDEKYQIKKETISEIYDDIFYLIDKNERITQKTKAFRKKIQKLLEKENRALKNNENILKTENKIEDYKKYADLILTNFYKFNKNEKEIKVFDYFEEKEITILLDYEKSVKENANIYYKKYNKLKRQKENLERMQSIIRENILKYENILLDILNVKTDNDILDIEQILKENKIIEVKEKIKKNKNKKEKEYKPNISKYIINNHIVYIGRNSLQNYFVTFKLSDPEDIWLHVKDYRSSHAIIKTNKEEIDEKTIEEVSKILLKESNLEKNIKYSIDYTKKKYVKKIVSSTSSSNVTYKNYKTIYISY